MSLITYFSFVIILSSAIADDDFTVDPNWRPITSVEALNRLTSWTEGDKQNIWELSGQFEGDILLEPDSKNGVVNARRWNNREMPYEIDSRYTPEQASLIERSLTEFQNKTRVRTRRRQEGDADYIFITLEKQGCFSYVGRKGGRQILNLGLGCLKLGVVLHEVLHAFGFHHQQNANNRDEYVRIIVENIKPDKLSNFKKLGPNKGTSYGHEYDYGSIMHYSAYAFSINNEKTIVTTKDPNAQIGQLEGFSPVDIAKLNAMYSC